MKHSLHTKFLACLLCFCLIMELSLPAAAAQKISMAFPEEIEEESSWKVFENIPVGDPTPAETEPPLDNIPVETPTSPNPETPPEETEPSPDNVPDEKPTYPNPEAPPEETESSPGNIPTEKPTTPDPEQPPEGTCLLYTSPSPRDLSTSRMPSSA